MHQASHLQLRMQLAEAQTARNVYYSPIATRRTGSTPDMLCPGHALSTLCLGKEPPVGAASGTISALRGNSKSGNYKLKILTEDQQLIVQELPQTTIDYKRSP